MAKFPGSTGHRVRPWRWIHDSVAAGPNDGAATINKNLKNKSSNAVRQIQKAKTNPVYGYGAQHASCTRGETSATEHEMS